jgi:ribosomal protein S18 acetylase RimI-like enzyme
VYAVIGASVANGISRYFYESQHYKAKHYTIYMNNNISVVEMRDAKLPDDADDIRRLWIEYLAWGNETMQMLHGVHPHDPKETVEQDIKMIAKFLPPDGRLMLAVIDNNVCGIGCLKTINEETGEIKRMYVDPSFRRVGAGRAILQSLLNAAIEAGYKKVRLDSPKFMDAAHSLYRSFGFKDIQAYPEVEIPEEFRQYLLFMELELN